MSKKKRQERSDRPAGADRPVSPGAAPVPADPSKTVDPVDPKFHSWQWYAMVYGGCVLFTVILYVAFFSMMRNVSKGYTDDGIAMYKMAKELQKQTTRDMDTIAGELDALDAVVDIEKLKSFLLSDVAYKPTIVEDTKAYIRLEAEKYGELVEHLREVNSFDDVQKKILDKTIVKISEIRECLMEVLRVSDLPDYEDRKRIVIGLDKKISNLGWYSMIGAGFFSWPAALDAAERSFFEALRFWQKNPEAAYWWGKVLEETSINDVAAEKKISAIKYDPGSALSGQIVSEFKAAYDADPGSARTVYNYAFALYRQGRVDEAMPLFHRVYDMDRKLNTFESFLAKRRIDIIERKIDMRWSKTDDF